MHGWRPGAGEFVQRENDIVPLCILHGCILMFFAQQFVDRFKWMHRLVPEGLPQNSLVARKFWKLKLCCTGNSVVPTYLAGDWAQLC